MTSGYKERELLRRDLRTWADYFANPSIERTRSGTALQALIAFWALRALPPRAAHVKR